MNLDIFIWEIMIINFIMVGLDCIVEVIQELFCENEFYYILVVDWGECLIGIISKEDVFKFFYVLLLQIIGKKYFEKEY